MTAPKTGPTYEDRCIGCLLGVACGDILGASVEAWPAAEIRETFGELRDFCDSDRGFGCYTDDTQMTVALAKRHNAPTQPSTYPGSTPMRSPSPSPWSAPVPTSRRMSGSG